MDKVRIYEIKIQSIIAQNQKTEALEIGVQVLKLLGVRLPAEPKMGYILVSALQTRLTLAGRKIEDLAYLPRMTDAYKLDAMHILMLLAACACIGGSLYFPLAVFAMVRLSVKYGNCGAAAFAYDAYGAILCEKFGDIEKGYISIT